MSPATWPREAPLDERLLTIDPSSGRLDHRHVRDLPWLLRPGDLLVVNDAATLPAALAGKTAAGEPVELRLVAMREKDDLWTAVLFGAGDWRTRTEDRAAPPRLRAGDVIHFGDLSGAIDQTYALSPRLVGVRFDRSAAPLWSAIYALGRPVQYAYVSRQLPLWHVQTRYASRPWAVELPSAGRPLTHALLMALSGRGVQVAALTHAAGLSSTGDVAIDAALPFPERFEIPAPTARAVEDTKNAGGRVIAVGTTVVRALEGSGGRRSGITDLRIDARFTPRIVDGLLTGMHEPTTSHYDLMRAFVSKDVLDRATRAAEEAGYVQHEFGDSTLVL